MSPILVRPVREQLEHDRVIRLLQAKYKRKFDVAINPGNEHSAPVGPPTSPWYPDLVLQLGKKLVGVVEVETAESLNNLEAMSQWVAFGKLRVPFHLYVPVSGIDSARRLCAGQQVQVAEMWAYSAIGDQLRFTLVSRLASAPPLLDRSKDDHAARPAAAARAKVSRPAKPVRKSTATSAKSKGVAVKKKATTTRPAATKRPARAAASSKPPKRK